MFSSLTPAALRDLRAPVRRDSMIFVFHRPWTMPTRRFEPVRENEVSQ